MTTKIQARPRGPLVIEIDGDVELIGPDGVTCDTSGMKRLTLCRCGASKARPFCDGSHNRVGFEAPPPDPDAPADDDWS